MKLSELMQELTRLGLSTMTPDLELVREGFPSPVVHDYLNGVRLGGTRRRGKRVVVVYLTNGAEGVPALQHLKGVVVDVA